MKKGIQGEAEDVDFDQVDDIQVYDDAGDVQQDDAVYEESEANHFFGILDRQELEYFKQAESLLHADSFGSSEEREGFIAGVADEMSGKELKLATSQVCSKLMERIILSGTDAQVRQIFKAFNGHFSDLSCQKYASHCAETLLVRLAPMAEREILEGPSLEEGSDEEYVSAENMILFIVSELKPKVFNELITHQYASHVLRMLMIVLTGAEIPSNSVRSALRSKKSKFARKVIAVSAGGEEFFGKSYQVPSSFRQSAGEIIKELAGKLDCRLARELSISKVASPFMQLAIRSEAESKRKKNKDLSLPGLIFNNGEGEESFVEYLLSDAVGSHFFEAMILSGLPIDLIERLYSSYMEGRLAKLARRDYGSYVIGAILIKVKAAKASKIIDQLVEENEGVYPSNLVRAIIEASAKHNLKTEELVSKLVSKDSQKDLLADLEVDKTLTDYKYGRVHSNPALVQKSAFIQTLVKAAPTVRASLMDTFTTMEHDKLMAMAKHPIYSHLVESCLEPAADTIRRRKLLNQITTPGSVVELACNAYGSHVIDKLWRFTYKLKFFRERIAEELLSEETKIKESRYGKMVWKTWSLDKYLRLRFVWWKLVKEEEDKIGETLGESHALVEQKQAPKSRTNPAEHHAGGKIRSRKHDGKEKTPYDRPSQSLTTRR